MIRQRIHTQRGTFTSILLPRLHRGRETKATAKSNAMNLGRLFKTSYRLIDSMLHSLSFPWARLGKGQHLSVVIPCRASRSYVLRRLARELNRREDPNCLTPDCNKGIDELADIASDYRAALLPTKVQNIVAFSQLMRKKTVPEGFRLALSRRYDDDAFLLLYLIDSRQKTHSDAVNAVFQRHGWSPAPLSRAGPGVQHFGFPQVAPAHGEKVTVAMTTKNNAATLEQAIKSVLNQSWRNLELIVVDDCSSDESYRILNQFEDADGRVRLLQNSTSIGTYCSKNRALEVATGKYFTCHDADDWSHPLKIERQVKALKSHSNDTIVATLGNWVRMDESGHLYFWGPGILCRNYSSLLFLTEQIRENIGFYDSVRIGADAELVGRIMKIFGDCAVHDTQELGSIGRYTSTSLTGNSQFRLGFRIVSPVREKYRKSHQNWHTTSQCLYLPREQHERKFSAPGEIIVSANSVSLATRTARGMI